MTQPVPFSRESIGGCVKEFFPARCNWGRDRVQVSKGINRRTCYLSIKRVSGLVREGARPSVFFFWNKLNTTNFDDWHGIPTRSEDVTISPGFEGLVTVLPNRIAQSSWEAALSTSVVGR